MYIEIKINPLGKSSEHYNDEFNDLLYKVEKWRRENPYATVAEAFRSELLTELNKCLYYNEISETAYNTLWYYFYHGHIQYQSSSRRRSGMAELDPIKKAYCYGIVASIHDDKTMLKDVHVDGVNEDGEAISFHISHVWIRTIGMKKAITGNRIREGDYIKFRGRPYQYQRPNKTKDYSFSNTNNRKIQKISEADYLRYINIGLEDLQ